VTAELTRLVPLSRVGAAGMTFVVRATPAECEAIAARMHVPAVMSLECAFDLAIEDDRVAVAAQGHLQAQVVRTCVISADDFETLVDDRFEVRFVPAGTERDDLDPALPDEIPYDAGSIDLGEATTEQLGLTLDPYPRIKGAELTDSEQDDSSSPFSVLARRLGPGKIGR
jgi:uncharacterized metal-binding protein YceD (DUF177 family)